MILYCTCKHPVQDRLYGPGRRVHNQTKDKHPDKFRCTVCKLVREK